MTAAATSLPGLPQKLSSAAADLTPTIDSAWTSATAAFLEAGPEQPTVEEDRTVKNPDLCLNFRHSGWMHFRKKVNAALTEMYGIPPRRIAAFQACGADAFVECQNHWNTGQPTEFRVRSTKCHDRFCVPCSQERGRIVRDQLAGHMMHKKNMSLITLTLNRSPDHLTDILDRITKHFRALRSKPLWKKAVKGGVAIIETKIGTDGTSWHCHYHILAEASYIEQAKLADLWREITGDSHIVDIRRVGSHAGAIKYVTNYVTKAGDAAIVNSKKHLQEAIVAFIGRRLVSTFASWRGLVLSERNDDEILYPPNDPEGKQYKAAWRFYRPLDEVIAKAGVGDAESLRLLRIIRRGRPEPPK